MVVHGIPGAYELKRGDILSIDIGVILDGWVADAAITHPIGNVTPIASSLLATTRGALFDAVEQCRAGNRLGDVSHAVQTRVEGDGFAVIRSLVGHGIGRDDARGPADPELRRRPAPARSWRRAWSLAIEPMVNVGTHHVRMGQDNWAVYSQDGALAAHFEHTVAITADGPAHPDAVARAGAGERVRPGCRLGLSSARGAALPRGLDEISAHIDQNSPNPPPLPLRCCRSAWPRPAVRRGRRNTPELQVAPAILAGRRGAVSWAPRWSSFRYGPDSRSYEGPRLSQAHVREVQGHPPRRCGPRDLSKPASQAAAGVTGD